MLKINGICKTFKSEDGSAVRALNGISMEVEKGTLVVLMGPNGSGKSTLFQILSREISQDSGTIEWETGAPDPGQEIAQWPRFVHVPQEPRALAFPDMKIEDQMLFVDIVGKFPRFWARGVTAARREKYRRFLKHYGASVLADAISRPLLSLSVGWQQMFALLLAVAGGTLADHNPRPRVFLLDEPTSALDEKNSDMCLSIISRLETEGHTIFVATHDVNLALRIAQRLCILHRGEVVADYRSEELASLTAEDLRRGVVEFENPVVQ